MVSQTFLVYDDLDTLGSTGKVFFGCPTREICLIRLRLLAFGKKFPLFFNSSLVIKAMPPVWLEPLIPRSEGSQADMPWSHPSIYSQSVHRRALPVWPQPTSSTKSCVFLLFSLAIPDVLTVSQTRPYLPSFMPMRLLLPLPKMHPSPWLPGNPHSEVRTQHTHKHPL